MKTVLFSLFFYSITLVCSSQITLYPEEVAVENLEPSDVEGVGYSFVTNQSESEKTIVWELNVIESGENWDVVVCDVTTCHFPGVLTAEFVLAAGETGNIDVHARPNGNDGGAIVEVKVSNAADETESVVGMYYFNQALSAPERVTNTLKIYPNPVVSEFFIDGADDVQRIEIYSITGKLVKEVQSFGQGSVNVEDLGTGNYIVRMWDNSNAQISTNVLSIQ